MDEEHVDEILSGAVEPVEVGRRLLRVLQEETVDAFDDSLGVGQRDASFVRQIAELVPFVADLLATLIDHGDLLVAEHVQFLSDRGDLLDSVLVSGQIAFERQMFTRQGSKIVQRALLEVGRFEQVDLALGPFFVNVALVLKLLRQMIESFEARETMQ